MKYIKSTTQKTYKIEGIKIPACVTSNNEYAELTEEQLTLLKNNAVGKSLIKSGGVLIVTEKPAGSGSSITTLTSNNAELIAKNTELTAQVETIQAKYDALQQGTKASALKECQSQISTTQTELDNANATIAELKAQLAAGTGTTE